MIQSDSQVDSQVFQKGKMYIKVLKNQELLDISW